MATDRPGDPGDDTGWFFEPQSDERAELSYRGEAPHHQPAPDAPVPARTTPPAPATPASSGAGSGLPATPATPSDPDRMDDTGQATAPLVPPWATSAQAGGHTGAAATAAASAGGDGAVGGGRTVPPGPGSTGSPNRSGDGGRPSGAGRAIALGTMIGFIVLLLAWYFLVRDPGMQPTHATPVRSSAASVSASATPTPKPTQARATRTTARPSPTVASAAPSVSPTHSPTPSPTSTLNDAANRLGWTYIIDGLGPVKLGLNADEATDLGVLQAVPSACDDHSPTDLLGATRVYSTGGKVTAIDIRTADFPSGRGIRVGATLDNLKTLYGDALKNTEMTDGAASVKQWALTSNNAYVAYVVDGADTVTRIAIGYRGSDGSIVLPLPC